MKKIIVLVVLIIMFGFIIKIPEYHELNDLAIIQGVGVEYKNHSYTIYMKEVIPVRSDMGIDYEFKYYEGESSDLEKAIERVQDKTKKKCCYARDYALLFCIIQNIFVHIHQPFYSSI